MSAPHISVLLQEIIKAFDGKSLHTYVDATLGAGGHAEKILEYHPEIETFVGIDQDEVALKIAKERLKKWQHKTHFVEGNFTKLKDHLSKLHFSKIDGMVLDLGVSSMQLDMAEKGFSFMREGPLDMRMDPNGALTADEIINTWPERELGRIFREYGEEKQWRAAARIITAAREKKPIGTTLELAELLRPIFSWKKKGINPLTLIFQGIRIAVNDELEVLKNVLPQAIDLLAPQGILAVISFHSLEDRIVKETFRFAASDKYDTSGIAGVFLDKDPQVSLLTRKPIIPSEEEIRNNPRSRSAKLRIIQKL